MKSLTMAIAAALALSVTAGLVSTASAAVGAAKPKPQVVTSKDSCGSDLGFLRRVYEDQIDFVVEASIVPVCEQDDYGLMRSDGNAGAIRQYIADNDNIMEALADANFGIDDVVGVRMTGDDSAVIFVHTFHYR